MYAQLGNIIFEGLVGFSSLEKSESVNYAEHALIKGKPTLQRVGSNLDEVKVGMLFHSRFCDPEAQVAALRSSMNSSEVMPFITGSGTLLGTYVIQKMGQTVERTTSDGAIISVRVEVELRESFQPNPIQAAIAAAVDAGFAFIENGPVESVAPIAPQQLTVLAAADITRGLVAERVAVAAIESGDMPAASISLGDMGGAFQEAAAKLNNITGSVSDQLEELQNDIAELLLEVNDVKTATDAGNAALALIGLEDLAVASNKVKRSNTTLAAIVASRR